MKKLSMIIIILIALFSFVGAANAATEIYAASLEGEISLHISPSEDSFVITQVPASSRLVLIKTERTWGLVSYRNKSGWVNLSFTRESYAKSAEATGNDMVSSVEVASENEQASLYNRPSKDGTLGSIVRYQVPNQTVLEITRQTPSGWGLVSMHGRYAWIRMEETKPFDTHNESDMYGIYYVYTLSEKGEGVNLYVDEFGKNLCGVIPDCVKLTVRETLGDYGYVSYDGIKGYINLKYTAQSLSNAQSNAGEKVNEEHIVKAPEGENAVTVYSIPSKEEKDGPSEVGTVKDGESVYILRSTLDGWSLINCGGQLGWIPPDSTSASEAEVVDDVEILTTEEFAYVSTPQGKGLKVASEPNGKEHAFIPENARIQILARKDGYSYVYSREFASGWVKEVPPYKTYEEARDANLSGKKNIYIVKEATWLRRLPLSTKYEENEKIAVVREGKYLEVKKIVSSGKTKWLLVEVNGKCGWISKTKAQREGWVTMICIASGIGVVVAAIIAFAVVAIVKKKRKKKEVEEIEESVHDENSGDREESPTLSGK